MKESNSKKIAELVPKIYADLLPMCLSESEKSVCATIMTGADTIVECLDCQADPSCIICIDCFKNGDHKGHRVYYRKGMGGCCDCGDP